MGEVAADGRHVTAGVECVFVVAAGPGGVQGIEIDVGCGIDESQGDVFNSTAAPGVEIEGRADGGEGEPGPGRFELIFKTVGR